MTDEEAHTGLRRTDGLVGEPAAQAPADLRVMAHELRTPIGAIIAFAEMIEREQFGTIGDNRYKEYARDIGSSARLALAIVAAGLEQNDVTPNLLNGLDSDIDLTETIESCLRLVERPAAEAGVQLVVQLPSSLPKLRTDASALKQILLNLLGNAIKFTPAGGSVTVAIGAINDGLRLTVTDTGLGMTVFDTNVLSGFASADQDAAPSRGIGFNLVRRLATSIGTRFDISSERGVGTTVALTFSEAQLNHDS